MKWDLSGIIKGRDLVSAPFEDAHEESGIPRDGEFSTWEVSLRCLGHTALYWEGKE
jgi:hypothetical protein